MSKNNPKNISISIPKDGDELLNYLNKQGNKSAYIWRLIEEDKRKKEEDAVLVEAMRNLLSGQNLKGVLETEGIKKAPDKGKKGVMDIINQ